MENFHSINVWRLSLIFLLAKYTSKDWLSPRKTRPWKINNHYEILVTSSVLSKDNAYNAYNAFSIARPHRKHVSGNIFFWLLLWGLSFGASFLGKWKEKTPFTFSQHYFLFSISVTTRWGGKYTAQLTEGLNGLDQNKDETWHLCFSECTNLSQNQHKNLVITILNWAKTWDKHFVQN